MNDNKGKLNEHAVSPVVGVMLMLVVTIIIAAVVSAFAGGLSSGAKETPQAAIDVKISNTSEAMSGGGPVASFTLVSGDSLPTKDLAIITEWTNKAGHTYQHKQTATSNETDLYGYETMARVPFLNDMRYGYAGFNNGGSVAGDNVAVDFGNFTWTVGSQLTTQNGAGTSDLLGINNAATPHGIADSDFGSGSVVEVKILHIPSGKIIFSKEVIVS